MISKYQNGGLTYQPFVQSILNQSQNSSEEQDTNDLLGPIQGTSFPVEPVKPWLPFENFYWNNTTQSDDATNIEVTPGNGKVYTESERDIFKTDLLNAYVKELQKRGMNEADSIKYAKRIVAQDALESRYGQSGLSKYYNFGGIKDFRENSDSLKIDTKEFENGKMKIKKQPFRKFKNLEEYVNYKIDLLGNSNFNIFSYSPDVMYTRLITAKKKYATDPQYERKLNRIYYLLWGK